MASWFWYAVAAAILYALHQIFTKVAAPHISEGLGGFIVEITAAITIGLYVAVERIRESSFGPADSKGVMYSVLTGVCVGAGTVLFFILFQKGGPLSAVPAILAGGAALMAIAGMTLFGERPSWQRVIGILLAITGLVLLRQPSSSS